MVLLVAACGATGSGDDGRVKVITTTTIFADMVREIGGDRVSVESLVPKGGEVHTFDPTPGDIRRITEAEIAFRNGLGLDDWLASLIEDAGTSAPLVALGTDLPGVTLIAGEEGSGEAVNPHLWMNVAYGSLYAERIAAELTKVDPQGATAYRDGRDPLAQLVLAQRFALALAAHRGLDPDRPRLLTRSVVLTP